MTLARLRPSAGAGICLQGGAEFGPACRDMDRAVLTAALAGRPGPVVVSALAGTVGRDYATASAHGARHYAALAPAGVPVLVAPDARTDPAGAHALLASASLVVLPGGSPSGLLAALTGTGAGEAVAAVLDAGGAVSGASAGAMVLCGWTVLPDAPGGMRVAPGLGLVPGALVLPHWRGGRQDWLDLVARAVPDGTVLLGLPEQGGMLLTADGHHVLGESGTQSLLVRRGAVVPDAPHGRLSVGARLPAHPPEEQT